MKYKCLKNYQTCIYRTVDFAFLFRKQNTNIKAEMNKNSSITNLKKNLIPIVFDNGLHYI